MAQTTYLAGTKLDTGQAQKEVTINTMSDLLDASLAGKLDIPTTGGTTTLTGTPAAPQAQNMFLNVSGTLASNATIEIPVTAGTGRNRIYVVKNGASGAFTLTVKKVGGTGVVVPPGVTVCLLYDGSDIVYLTGPSSFIGARVYNSADISIADSTATILTFNSERYDTLSIHSTSSNTGRLTIPFAGKWCIGAAVDWDANATGYRSSLVRKNGSTVLTANTHPAASGADTNQPLNTEDLFAAGDYVEIVVAQNSGGALNVKSLGNYSPEAWISLIGF